MGEKFVRTEQDQCPRLRLVRRVGSRPTGELQQIRQQFFELGGGEFRGERLQLLPLALGRIGILQTGENPGDFPLQPIEIAKTEVIRGQTPALFPSPVGFDGVRLWRPLFFGQFAVALFLVVDAQGIHQHVLGVQQEFLVQFFGEITVFIGNRQAFYIKRKCAGRPGENFDDRQLDQHFQRFEGGLPLDLSFFDQHGDQRLPGFAGAFLVQECLRKGFLRYRPGLDQNFPDANAVVRMVGTDDVPAGKDQLALALASPDTERPRLFRGMQQLDDIDNGQVFKVSGK